MTNLQKRILTSLIIIPLSFLFIFKGGYYLLSFLMTVFFIANVELFSVFKRKSTILFLDLVLILSLFSIYYLADLGGVNFHFLIWLIILVIFSDIGGYVFGKIFKWKKFTKISPKKTVSGVFGSFVFSLASIFFVNLFLSTNINFLDPKFFFLAIILSLVAQTGDLTISYLKRIEKIKDTGKILPGHGGIFDRIDGLMFVVILGFVLSNFNIVS
jgi:phosphatidate cytidylyltransferase